MRGLWQSGHRRPASKVFRQSRQRAGMRRSYRRRAESRDRKPQPGAIGRPDRPALPVARTARPGPHFHECRDRRCTAAGKLLISPRGPAGAVNDRGATEEKDRSQAYAKAVFPLPRHGSTRLPDLQWQGQGAVRQQPPGPTGFRDLRRMLWCPHHALRDLQRHRFRPVRPVRKPENSPVM